MLRDRLDSRLGLIAFNTYFRVLKIKYELKVKNEVTLFLKTGRFDSINSAVIISRVSKDLEN